MAKPMKNLFYYVAFVFFNTTIWAQNNTIYIIPIGGLGNVQALFFAPYSGRDEVSMPFYKLRVALEDRGYRVKFTVDAENLNDVAGIIAFQDTNSKLLSNLRQYDRKKCILFLYEPPVVMPSLYTNSFLEWFGTVFSLIEHPPYKELYRKFYYPQPRSQMIENVSSFEHKKFCVLINGNKNFYHPQSLYAERRKIIHFFENNYPKDFDLYGPDWHGYYSWKGGVVSKWETLKNYKFCICYENMKDQRGYITEKIFDCFVGGCVPVYWGAANITDYVPANCFIDRRVFASDQALYNFLKTIDKNTYNQYMENIKKYLASPQMYLFSIENFIDIITKALDLHCS
jgi:hypothetical protein